MERIVYANAQNAPNGVAVTDGEVHLSYAGLVVESTHLAKELLTKMKVPLGEPIVILLGPGAKQVICQLAVLLAGGTCVPLEPSLPERRISDMLHDIHVRYVLTERDGPVKVPGLEPIYVESPRTGSTQNVPGWKFVPKVSRSHILFTSGSTGKPKAVQIRAESIVHLATKTPATPLSPNDRVAEFNNPGFDLSLFEIWATLIAGATIVTIPRQIATDPGALSYFLRRNEVSVIVITAALFDITVFASAIAFRTLRHVLTAGDVANVRAMRRVLEKGPPEHLWNTYGPTECTTLATMHEISLEETQRDRISIGRPVGKIEIFLLDGERPVGRGERGEIHIGGPCLSMGYFEPADVELDHDGDISECDDVDLCETSSGKKSSCTSIADVETKETSETDIDLCEIFPEIDLSDLDDTLSEVHKPLTVTEQSFVHIPRSMLGVPGGIGEATRLYRTGDIAEWRSDDCLDFIGRSDNQVKQGGFRVELGDVEQVLCSHQEVRAAVVIQQPPQSDTGMHALVAFIIAESARLKPEALTCFARDRLPLHMVPSAVEIVADFPLTANCKVDRNALVQRRLDALKPSSFEVTGPDKDITILQRLWSELLNIPQDQIKKENDFFALGATSMHAAALLALIKDHLGYVVTMNELHDNSRLSDLLHLIQQR